MASVAAFKEAITNFGIVCTQGELCDDEGKPLYHDVKEMMELPPMDPSRLDFITSLKCAVNRASGLFEGIYEQAFKIISETPGSKEAMESIAEDAARVARASKVLRVMRILRSLRLLRLVKLKKLAERVEDHISSDYMKIFVDVLKLVMLRC